MTQEQPTILFLSFAMRIFWDLYPDLEHRILAQRDQVIGSLRQEATVLAPPLVGDEEDARTRIPWIHQQRFDLVVVWECGYVASGIPFSILQTLSEAPVLMLVTQRDARVPPDMDYVRYMESTAPTSAAELGGVLVRFGLSFDSLVGMADDPVLYGRVLERAKAARIRNRLHGLLVGQVGSSYPGMLDISVDEATVRRLGPRIHHIPLSDIASRLAALEPVRVDRILADWRGVFRTERVRPDDLRRIACAYAVLEDLALEYRLEAICVHDYECLSPVTGTVSDVALSMLENRLGISTGVEGDLMNCLGAYIARGFSGQSPMFVDWTMMDEERNTLFFQHNGKADPDRVTDPALAPCAEPFGGVIGEGAAVEASLKPGPVTWVGLAYTARGWTLFAMEGTALAEPVRPCRLNQATVRPEAPVGRILERACTLGAGHHGNIAPGHFAGGLSLLSTYLGIPFIRLDA